MAGGAGDPVVEGVADAVSDGRAGDDGAEDGVGEPESVLFEQAVEVRDTTASAATGSDAILHMEPFQGGEKGFGLPRLRRGTGAARAEPYDAGACQT